MNLQTAKILVVEDNLALNRLITAQLQQRIKLGILNASTLSEAEKHMTESGSDIFLAIIDLNLPDAPNGEIVDSVLSKKIPALVVSATVNEETQREILSKGVIDYVIKRNSNELEYVADTAERLFHNFNKTVLVVDDTLVSRMLLKALLSRMNLNVIEAENGEQALEKIENNKVHLAITDQNMPGMDGVELIYKIREKFSRTELPVIGVSATNDGSTASKLLKAGANDFINRDFAPEEFTCRINQVMDVSDNTRQCQQMLNRDYLTNLYNRHYLFSFGSQMFASAVKKSITMIAARIDINQLTNINRNHGYEAGDLAIKQIASMLHDATHKLGLLCRTSGTGFCLLWPRTNSDEASSFLTSLINKLDQVKLTHQNREIDLSICIGFSSIEQTGSLDEAIIRAEEALQKAKQSGCLQAVAAE